MKKYNYNDHFDMLTIRQEFLQDVGHVEEDYIVEFNTIAEITASLMYDKYKYNYESVSFNVDDIKSLARIYLVGYLGRYGFRYNEDGKNKFIGKFTNTKKRQPNTKDLKRAERTQIITFLRQKLYHCATVCERKSRNINVSKNKCRYFAKTVDSVDVDPLSLLDDHKKYGYRPVSLKEMKEAKKTAKENQVQEMTDTEGFEIVKSQFLDPGINSTEYLMLLDRRDTIYTSTPESYLLKMEEERRHEENANSFKTMPQGQKIQVLKTFIRQNKENDLFKEEVVNARKLLKRHSFWYGSI